MTARVLVLASVDPDLEVHVHVERRDPAGRFVRDAAPLVIRPPRDFVELYAYDGVQLVVSEHPLSKTEE